MYQTVDAGLANGFLHRNTIDPGVGVPLPIPTPSDRVSISGFAFGGAFCRASATRYLLPYGGVAEWLMAAVQTVEPLTGFRRFESCPPPPFSGSKPCLDALQSVARDLDSGLSSGLTCVIIPARDAALLLCASRLALASGGLSRRVLPMHKPFVASSDSVIKNSSASFAPGGGGLLR